MIKLQNRSAPPSAPTLPSLDSPASDEVNEKIGEEALWPLEAGQQYRIAPSFIHRTLLSSIALGAVMAIAITNMPLPLQVLAVLAVISGFVYQFKVLSIPVILAHQGGCDDTANSWQIQLGNHRPFDVTLIAKGYRSSALLILAFQADADRRIHYVSVWSDSINPSQYSYLNLQLLFNTENKESQNSRKC